MNLHKLARPFLAAFLGLLIAVPPALAQYGSGGMGSGSTGGYTPPKGGYGSGAAIGIGAGAAAAVGITYLALHSRATLIGCVQPSTDGIKLLNEKDQHTYTLVASNLSLNPGERVALRGKKSKNDSGAPSFQVSKLVKDYGSCKQ